MFNVPCLYSILYAPSFRANNAQKQLSIFDIQNVHLYMSAGLPPELYTIIEAYPWRFGTAYCLFKTFLTEMTSSASILTIAAFTIERYLAICHSLRTQATSGLSRAIRCIIIVWIVASLTAVVYPIHTRTFYFVMDPRNTSSQTTMASAGFSAKPLVDSLICTIPGKWMPKMRYAFQVRVHRRMAKLRQQLFRNLLKLIMSC